MTNVVKLSKDWKLKDILERMAKEPNKDYYFSNSVVSEFSKVSAFGKESSSAVYLDIQTDSANACFKLIAVPIPCSPCYRLVSVSSSILNLDHQDKMFVDTVNFEMVN